MAEITAYRNTVTHAYAAYETGSVQLAWRDGAYSDRHYTVESEPVTVRVRDGYEVAPTADDDLLLFPTGEPNAAGMTVAEAIKQGIARLA